MKDLFAPDVTVMFYFHLEFYDPRWGIDKDNLGRDGLVRLEIAQVGGNVLVPWCRVANQTGIEACFNVAATMALHPDDHLFFGRIDCRGGLQQLKIHAVHIGGCGGDS